MVSLTGKYKVGSTEVSEGGQISRPIVGGRNFKIYLENGQQKVGERLDKSARETGTTSRRRAQVSNKVVFRNSASNRKGGFKSTEKSSEKYGTSANIHARKALADISNAQGNSVRNIGRDGSKMKVSAVSGTRIMGVSLKKSSMGIVQGNRSQGDVQLDASKRVGTDLRASLDDQKNNTNAGRSIVVIKNRFSRKPAVPATTRVQANVSHASSRKSTKPLVKSTTSTAQRTLKLKSMSGQNKSELTAEMPSQDEKAVASSLSENGLVVVSDDANQGHLPSNGESNLRTDLSVFIPRKRSTHRKSYTTSLMERSKFLKESGDVMEQDNLPKMDNECNQLEVSEYIDEIYHYYWVSELQNPALTNYMSIQTDITPHMRGILINWLIEVHFKFDFMPETLYLTVTLLDRYLSLETIKKTDMQLVGLTSLLLASKYEDFWHPTVKDLISISAESYTRDEMLEMEKLVLRKLKFRLNAPTPYVFMVRFLKAAHSDMKLEHMAFFLIDLCLVEYEALSFKPSLLCASAVYVARCTLQMTPPWTPLLQKHARYEISQIRGCAAMILKFHKAAEMGKLKVTYEKYSRQELSGVAAVKPMDRLPR